MTATKTANGCYSYSQLYYNEPLDSYIQYAHKVLSEKSGWNYKPLIKGSFGYDNLAVSIGHMLEKYTPDKPYDTYASLIHEGWSINYLYWRDHLPGHNNPELYISPYTPLGDKRRNQCAETCYEMLTEEEKTKDLIIANAVVDYANKSKEKKL